MLIPVILCGGSGTRLWPLSRQAYPKQFLSLIGEKTLLETTMERALKINNASAPILVANEAHRFLVAEQVRGVGDSNASILLEPVGRNTAPAVACACFHALGRYEDPSLIVMPSDHFFKKEDAFVSKASLAMPLAEDGRLVTFGIVPAGPETGYGYIKRGRQLTSDVEAFSVEKFVEKPDIETAQRYVSSSSFYWNSGIFLFKASSYLQELERFRPEIYAHSKQAYEKGVADLDFFRLDEKSFRACPSESIDYAVMENTSEAVVVPVDAGWDDLGGWAALGQHGEKDQHGNVVKGDVILEQTENCYLRSEARLVAALGVKDLVVVETPDALLVASREKAQGVKSIVQKLKALGRSEPLTHKKVYRPWGSYETVDISDRFQVKRITVNPGQVLSLQMHHHRAEHWVVVKGTARIVRGDEEILLTEDQSTYIPLGVTHRLENPGVIPLELLEVQTGSYLGEDDIVWFEDVYGRTKS